MVKQPKQSKGPNFLIIAAIIFVILFIVVMVIPNIGCEPPRGPRYITRSTIAATDNVLAQYYQDTGHYPSTSEGIKALLERPASPAETKWKGPYGKKSLFKDGWGRELRYQSPGVHNPDAYDLCSYGADGKKGGEGVDADIGNW